ncbi:hypothetical protein IQ238_21565 [Pleurocapsales cyanobacterium LEGE 06147]|nr:hypothetical protein [Pleurocapsales cyanobacterium LEGE 06147]
MTSNQLSHTDSNLKASSKFCDRFRRGSGFYLLLGIAGAGLLLLIARPIFTSSSDNRSAETVAADRPRVLPVETIEVQPVDSYEVSRVYTGEIVAQRTSNLGFSRSGELEQVLVREGDRALVRGTLQPGDRLVVNGTHRLVPGQRVRPL